MATHIQKINDFVEQLTAMGELLFDSEIRMILIRSLLVEYFGLIASFSI